MMVEIKYPLMRETGILPAAFLCFALAPLLAQPRKAPVSGDAPAAAIGIFERRCAQCHGESSGLSGLKLTSRESILKGGSRGAALVPGKPDESLLYKAVAHTGEVSMPPGG